MFALLTASETKRKAKTVKQPTAKAKAAKILPVVKVKAKTKVHPFDDPAYLATLGPKTRKIVTICREIGKTGVWKK